MNPVTRWAARIRSRARALGVRSRLLAALLACLVLVGCAWLAYEASHTAPVLVPVTDEPMEPADLARAEELARRRGIAFRVAGHDLLVPPAEASDLRAALVADDGLDRRPGSGDLADVYGGILTSEAERDRRSRAILRTELSRLIGEMRRVRRATVLFTPGVQRSLGRPPVPAAASVKLSMADGAELTAALAQSIADLLCGSIVGLDRQNVYVVDDSGRGYRLDGSRSLPVEDPIDRLRRAEAHHRRRIQEALQYIDDVVVAVSVSADSPASRCSRAVISVPRRYLAAMYRGARPAAGDPSDAEVAAFAAAGLARIRDVVAGIIAAEDANAVTVDWHYDAPPAAAATGAPAPRSWAAGEVAAAVVAAGLAGPLLACAAWLLRRKGILLGRRSREAADDAEGGGEPSDGRPAEAAAEPADSALSMIRAASGEELLPLLRDEHPQTVALVLGCVEPAMAAAVLESLGPVRQVDVALRIAELGPVDAGILDEVARGLVSRWAADRNPAAEAVGGVGKVARILHHAGYATEKVVLEGLNGQQPQLAESIRKRMFAFEDVALLPAEVLRSALESLGRDELAIALRTAGKDVTEKTLGSLPRDVAREVRTEMERIGPVRLSDVEAAQDRVVEAVRRLEGGRYVPNHVAAEREVLA